MNRSQLTRTRQRAYSIVDGPKTVVAFGFATQGTNWTAVEYAEDGTIVRTVGVLDVQDHDVIERPTGQNASCIRGALQVDPGSLAWRDDTRIRVWSLSSPDSIYEHTIADDHVASPPIFADGSLFWFEVPAVDSLTWKLIQATPDLSAVGEIGTADPDPLGFGFVFEWHPPKLIAHTGSHVIGSAYWETFDAETGVATVRIPVSSGGEDTAPQHDTLGRDDEHDRAILHPHNGKAFGVVIGTDGDSQGSSLVVLEDDPEAITGAHWPRSGDWSIPVTRNGDAYGGRGLVHAAGKVIIATIDGPPADPEHVFEPAPIGGKAPDLVFLGA